VSFRPLSFSLSRYQVVEVPRSQTEDLGSSPSKSMLKFLNFFFLIFGIHLKIYFYVKKKIYVDYPRVFYCQVLPTE